jgi:ubiquitin carboxyl-terminal hydrolase 14
MNDLSRKLTRAGPGVEFGPEKDAVSALFGVELSTKLKCIESEAEPVSEGADVCKRLQCNIRTETMTIEEGLKLGLEAEIEKQAQTLGRNALFKQTRRIRRLPKYLAVQENRFYWKRNADGQGGVACKILKQVKFAPTLDVFDLCDDKLKEVLKGPRDQYLRERMGRDKKPAQSEGASSSSSSKDAKAASLPAAPATKDTPADKDTDAEMADADEELKAALKLSMGEGAVAAAAAPAAPAGSAGIGLPTNFRGVYELFALVTHKGRASDSGHYVGWVKAKGEDEWVCFDDEQASACKTDDILLLSGGGDRDMCYLCFYRAKE